MSKSKKERLKALIADRDSANKKTSIGDNVHIPSINKSGVITDFEWKEKRAGAPMMAIVKFADGTKKSFSKDEIEIIEDEKLSKGATLRPEKAAKMFHDGTANGKKLSKKQQRYFALIASRDKANDRLAKGKTISSSTVKADKVNSLIGKSLWVSTSNDKHRPIVGVDVISANNVKVTTKLGGSDTATKEESYSLKELNDLMSGKKIRKGTTELITPAREEKLEKGSTISDSQKKINDIDINAVSILKLKKEIATLESAKKFAKNNPSLLEKLEKNISDKMAKIQEINANEAMSKIISGDFKKSESEEAKIEPAKEEIMNWSEEQCNKFLKNNWGFRGVNGGGITKNKSQRTLNNLRAECLSQRKYNIDTDYGKNDQNSKDYDFGAGSKEHKKSLKKDLKKFNKDREERHANRSENKPSYNADDVIAKEKARKSKKII